MPEHNYQLLIKLYPLAFYCWQNCFLAQFAITVGNSLEHDRPCLEFFWVNNDFSNCELVHATNGMCDTEICDLLFHGIKINSNAC